MEYDVVVYDFVKMRVENTPSVYVLYILRCVFPWENEL